MCCLVFSVLDSIGRLCYVQVIRCRRFLLLFPTDGQGKEKAAISEDRGKDGIHYGSSKRTERKPFKEGSFIEDLRRSMEEKPDIFPTPQRERKQKRRMVRRMRFTIWNWKSSSGRQGRMRRGF